MRLHIFNPEHDIALAANMERFTAPHAGRQLRADLGFLPALWAEDGDVVLVDDAEAAVESVRHIKSYAHDVLFVSMDDLRQMDATCIDAVYPWGWDRTLCFQLRATNSGLSRLLPDDDALQRMRLMSNRRFAAETLLPQLRLIDNRLIGESTYYETLEDVACQLQRNNQSVIKAPWSSSGRGVRYVNATLNSHLDGWVRNVIARQGGVTVEPLYSKVYDFGMEFVAHPDGNVDYCGLSLFDTTNGAYIRSILATENDKREMLAKRIDIALVDKVRDAITEIMRGAYQGPFGVDMMIVADEERNMLLLHPCVELNLRRTMGHVALAISPNEYEARRYMSITYTDKYRLRITNSTENLLNTSLV